MLRSTTLVVASLSLLAMAQSIQAQDDVLERRFKAADVNGDGVITPDELKNEVLFKRLDVNGDGKVTRDEAAKMLAPSPPAQSPLPKKEGKPLEPLKPLAAPLRDLDPVIVLGEKLPQLLGKAPEKVVAFCFENGWRQIPVQIDERVRANLGQLRGGAGQKEFITTVYTGGGRAAPDNDPNFDADDELVFMYKDAGLKANGDDPKGVEANSRVELKVVDDLGKEERFVYLFLSMGELKSDAGKKYVTYQFKLLQGNLSGNGPNREDSVVTTSRSKNRFSDRWVHDAMHITAGDATGVNILDRDEFEFKPGVCNRTTDTFSEGAGAIIANIDGPVRGVRSVMGCNSGTYCQRDHFFYEGRTNARFYYRVHPIGATWSFLDFSPAATGMTYYDNLNHQGVTIDGEPDDIKAGPLDWQYVTGKQGSLSIAWKIDTDILGLQRTSYYFDDKHSATWKRCTGDDFAYGASGPATGDLPNTDPLLVGRAGHLNRYELERTVYYDAPLMPLADAQKRITAAWFPLRAE